MLLLTVDSLAGAGWLAAAGAALVVVGAEC